MNDQQGQIAGQVTKVVTVWAAIGITSWAEAASFAAFLYSMVLLGEWFWKKLIKPFLIYRGWIKPQVQCDVESD